VLLSIGLALIALGLPTERYFGSMGELWKLIGLDGTPRSLLALPVLATDALLVVGLERSAFLWSALLYGSSVFLLLRLLQTIGFSHRTSLAATLVAILSPVAWLGGTLPINYAAGLLGSTLLCTSLFQRGQTHRHGYLWRAASFLVLAYMLQPECLWLLPATLLAVIDRGKTKDSGRLNAFGLAAVFLVCLWAMGNATGDGWTEPKSTLMGSMDGSSSWYAGLGFWVVGLGAAWLGIVQLCLGSRVEEEAPAPRWVLAWLIVGLVPLMRGGDLEGPAGAFLIPIAAVGVADALTRRANSVERPKVAALFFAGQLLILGGSVWYWSSHRPHGPWFEVARTSLIDPNMRLSTDYDSRAYLARFRLGIYSREEEEGYSTHEGQSPRVIYDRAFLTKGILLEPEEEWEGIRFRGPGATLTDEGLK
ncbi:MAG: hypothetical protein KDB61_09700, partial [Planctomycetes bacterium]|nr:hypothetical protein [Planctomycetota bacterium]